MAVLPTQSDLQIHCNFNGFFFFCINGKANSQIHVEWQEAPHSQNSIHQKKNKPGRLTFLISKLTIKHTVIQTVWCWHKDGHIDK